jgi:hypothetical protein
MSGAPPVNICWRENEQNDAGVIVGLEILERHKMKRNIFDIFCRCFLYMVATVGIEPTRSRGKRHFEAVSSLFQPILQSLRFILTSWI